MKKTGRLIGASLSLTAAALLGPSTAEVQPVPAHHATPIGAVALKPGRAPMSPDAARLAITSSLTCGIASIGETYQWHNDTANLTFDSVEIDLEVHQSADALAAQAQYALSDAVLWRSFVGGQVYSHQSGGYKDKGMSMTSLDGGHPHSGNQQADMPIEAEQQDDTLLVYAGVDVRIGDPHDGTWRATVAKVPCGALQNVVGHWQIDPALQVAGNTTTYTNPAAFYAAPAPYAFINNSVFPRPHP